MTKGAPKDAHRGPGTPKGAKGRSKWTPQVTEDGQRGPKDGQMELKAPQREPEGSQSQAEGSQKNPKSAHYINKLPINRPSGRYVI